MNEESDNRQFLLRQVNSVVESKSYGNKWENQRDVPTAIVYTNSEEISVQEENFDIKSEKQSDNEEEEEVIEEDKQTSTPTQSSTEITDDDSMLSEEITSQSPLSLIDKAIPMEITKPQRSAGASSNTEEFYRHEVNKRRRTSHNDVLQNIIIKMPKTPKSLDQFHQDYKVLYPSDQTFVEDSPRVQPCIHHSTLFNSSFQYDPI